MLLKYQYGPATSVENKSQDLCSEFCVVHYRLKLFQILLKYTQFLLFLPFLFAFACAEYGISVHADPGSASDMSSVKLYFYF